MRDYDTDACLTFVLALVACCWFLFHDGQRDRAEHQLACDAGGVKARRCRAQVTENVLCAEIFASAFRLHAASDRASIEACQGIRLYAQRRAHGGEQVVPRLTRVATKRWEECGKLRRRYGCRQQQSRILQQAPRRSQQTAR